MNYTAPIFRLAGETSASSVEPHARRQNRRLNRGFSFVELLFAIMILGIGFIMIAAIFPVAIRQTAKSGEETIASTIAKGAAGVIQQYASNALMPGTNGQIVPIGPTTPTGQDVGLQPYPPQLWNAISGNMILPSDNRYAWAAMYERDGYFKGQTNPPYAEVIIIGMQVRNRSQYTSADTSYLPNGSGNTYPNQPNLQPKQVYVQFTPGNGTTPDEVTFLTNSSTPEAANASAVAEGCYLVVSNDNGNHTTAPASYPNATCNGQIYRIGNPVAGSANTWGLMPGNDMVSQASNPVQPLTTGSAYINALIVGRSIHDPTLPYYDPNNPPNPVPSPAPSANPYEGQAQDISIYATFVRINN